MTSDASAVAGDASLDMVVEVAGGTDAGMLELLLACGGRGVSVVTANKALLAELGATAEQIARHTKTTAVFSVKVTTR